MTDWFRSWHGAPTDPKWRTIAKRANVTPCLVVSVAWVLLDRASQADTRGSIDGTDVETMADFLGCEAEEIERIIAAMHDKAVLTSDRFTAWERRQPKREREDDTAAERKATERARKGPKSGSGNGGTGDVTPGHTTSHQVTPREEERRVETPSPSGDGRLTADEREPELAFRADAEPSKPKLVAVNGDVLQPEPQDPEKRLFEMGREVLLRGPNPVKKGGGLIASLLRSLNNDIPKAQECVDLAWGKQDPGEYLGACLKKAKTNPPARAAPHNPRLAASRRLGEYLDAQSR